jgi:homoserine kinase
MSSQDNSKLIATAVGAAAAGAALAVAALKMIESSKTSSFETQRPHRSSIFMNDPSDVNSQIPGGIVRRESDSLLFPHNHEEKMRRRIATRYTIEEENNTPRQSVTVRVPATSANVGPGCKSRYRKQIGSPSMYLIFCFFIR